MKEKKLHKYNIEIRNGRVNIYIDSLLHLSFSQLSYLGLYSYRDDTSWYGLDIFLKETTLTLEYETRETWEQVLKLLDSKL